MRYFYKTKDGEIIFSCSVEDEDLANAMLEDDPDLLEGNVRYDTHIVVDGEVIPRSAIIPTLDELKAALKEKATTKRFAVETNGITLESGLKIHTTLEDQNRITSVIANARNANIPSVDFKGQSGWVQLTIEQLESIASAIALHVQHCFSTEKAHHEAIDALTTLEQIEAYDITTGWLA